MNIHQEKEIRNVKDRELWSKLLAYAKPYWKVILLSLVMAGFIVVAQLVQPMIVQVAIDDRINGYAQQMIAVPQEELESVQHTLRKQGWNTKTSIDWQEESYIRLGHLEFSNLHPPEVGQPAQIIQVEGDYYLLSEWVDVQQTPTVLQSANNHQVEGDRQPSRDWTYADEMILSINDAEYRALVLTEEAIETFRHQDYIGFIYLAFIFLIAVGGGALLHYYQHNILQFAGQSIIFDIRQKMFEHLARMQMSFFNRNPVGRLVTRVTHDTEALNQLYSQVIVNLVREALILIGIIAVMFYYSVQLTLITFTVIPVLVIVTFYYKNIIRKGHRYVRLVLSHLNAYLAENLSGIRIIQMFTREQKQLKQFDELNEEHYRAGMRNSVINSIFNPAIGFIGNVALALLVWYGGGQVLAGAVTFGVVYLFTDYARRFFQPLMALADRYNQIQTAMASSERVFELLEEEPTITSPEQPKLLPDHVQGSIEFNHVWFAYENEEWVLQDIDFHIKPGETVAFVGATGAGKSSIIRLINRFYDIQKGGIRIDGIDIRDMEIRDLRKRVGIIQQDPFVFTGDMNYNIRLNRKDFSDEDVIAAAQSVNMDEFIRKLPEQYHTPLGEQGVTLSAGQQQLLSFLRAMVYSPDILILDEATANIDTETEVVVQHALRKLSSGRTTLIVAHRLATIQHADKIIVLHKGKIQEMGNHQQLLKKRGLYHRLYEIQNKERSSVSQQELETWVKQVGG